MMSLPFHPEMGTIVMCDFDGELPEMDKRRPAVVISPKFKYRDGLCTVVPFSTTPPYPVMSYNCMLTLEEPLPKPYDSLTQWVKGDMLATVSFARLNLPHIKDDKGKRIYLTRTLPDNDLHKVRECVLHALAFSHLTEYL